MVSISSKITKHGLVFKFQMNWVWEFILFFSILLLAHFQAAIIPILLGIISIKKFKHIRKNELIPLGFIFLGLASISEMIDHTQSSWIYIDHSSLFNWFFYSFLSLGLTCLSISVIKKDGSRELFDKQKLFTGISRACEKTTFTSEAIINFVDGIESQIVQDSNKDIKSSQIGELILKSLRKENEVAYIRYASVYRKFNGVKDFISTLESLKGSSKNQLASIS